MLGDRLSRLAGVHLPGLELPLRRHVGWGVEWLVWSVVEFDVQPCGKTGLAGFPVFPNWGVVAVSVAGKCDTCL